MKLQLLIFEDPLSIVMSEQWKKASERAALVAVVSHKGK
jgi:hypothetical protein